MTAPVGKSWGRAGAPPRLRRAIRRRVVAAWVCFAVVLTAAVVYVIDPHGNRQSPPDVVQFEHDRTKEMRRPCP